MYLGLEFRYLRRLLYSAAVNVSLGRFYNGAQGTFRVNAPGRLPFYIAPGITYNKWDFQQTGGLLQDNALSTQVNQSDLKIGAQIGVSPRYRSRGVLDVGAFYNVDNYANTAQVNSSDVLDRTSFKGGTAAIRFARNSFNKKHTLRPGGGPALPCGGLRARRCTSGHYLQFSGPWPAVAPPPVAPVSGSLRALLLHPKDKRSWATTAR